MKLLGLKFNKSGSNDFLRGKNNHRGWIKVIRRLLAIVVIVAVFAYIVAVISSNWTELSNSLKQANRAWIGVSVAGVMSYFALLLLVWGMVIRATGNNISLRAIIISGYLPSLGKYVPGKVWSVASRVLLLNKYGGVVRTRAAAATFLQYIFELAGAAPFILCYAWLEPLPQLSLGRLAPIVVPAIIVAIFPGAAWKLMSALLLRVGRTTSFELMGPTFTPGVYLLFVFHWSIYGLSGIALCLAFSNFDGPTAVGIGCAFVASWLIGFISLLTPGGIGVREGSMILLLTPLIGNSTAVLVSVLARVMWTVGDGGGALIALWFALDKKSA